MRAYILQTPDRKAPDELITNLSLLGFSPVPFEGLTPADLDVSKLHKIYSKTSTKIVFGRELSLPEICCVLGHREIMKDFLTTDDEWALVLEDDAILTDGIADFNNIKVKINRPTILQLFHGEREYSWFIRDENILNAESLLQYPPSTGTVAYLINKKACLIGVDLYKNKKIDSPADWPNRWLNQIDIWHTKKMYIKHPELITNSLIRNSRDYEGSKSKNRNIWAILLRFLYFILGIHAICSFILGSSISKTYFRDLLKIKHWVRKIRIDL